MKKYIIFIATFFGIVFTQFGYGQGINLDEVILTDCNPDNDFYNLCRCEPAWCDSGDPCDFNSSAYNEDECYGNNGEQDCNGDTNGYAYESYCGCIGGNTGITECPENQNDEGNQDDQTQPEPEVGRNWFLDQDLDGYHGAHTFAVNPPDNTGRWNTSTRGADCDDTKSEFTTVCCPDGQILDGNGGCKFDPCANKDLRNKEVSNNVKNMIDQRMQMQVVNAPRGRFAVNVKSFKVQDINDGYGDINLDHYALNINKLPNGYSPQQLFEEIRTNFYDLVTGGDHFWEKAEFMSYAGQDTNSWGSTNPVGSAMDFDTLMDTATVICTEYNHSETYWVFTTVHSVDHLGHPVSGHRWFGIEENGDGSYSFVVRGADRLATWVDSAANVTLGLGGDFAFDLADRTWKNLMETIEKFINDKPGGEAKPFDKNKEYGKRHEYNEEDCPE